MDIQVNHLTKTEALKFLKDNKITNPEHSIVWMEKKAREEGSTTGNIEEYSFVLHIDPTTNGFICISIDISKQ